VRRLFIVPEKGAHYCPKLPKRVRRSIGAELHFVGKLREEPIGAKWIWHKHRDFREDKGFKVEIRQGEDMEVR
jgi:hypothetical protein